MVWPVRFRTRFRDGLLALLGLAVLGLAAVFALHQPSDRPVRLRMTAGQEAGTRHRIGEVLRREAIHRAIAIDLLETAGSAEAIEAVQSGRVDVAFVQGGIDMTDRPGLRQVAAPHVAPPCRLARIPSVLSVLSVVKSSSFLSGCGSANGKSTGRSFCGFAAWREVPRSCWQRTNAPAA